MMNDIMLIIKLFLAKLLAVVNSIDFNMFVELVLNKGNKNWLANFLFHYYFSLNISRYV